MNQITFLVCLLCSFIPFSGFAGDPGIDIAGKSAITIDPDTLEIIFAKDMDRRMYPASTTKLVTALLLAELKAKEDVFTYSAQAQAVYPYKLDLPIGSGVQAKYAMDALLLFSGNDIAYMIGENIGGSIDQFSVQMNEYTKELGLQQTHFVNPSGLHAKDHYSTAYDLSIVAGKLYEFPWIMESMGKKESRISVNDTIIEMKNRNKLVMEKGCVGGKTGWTPQAGRCLVALFEREQRRMIGVVLGSIYDTRDVTVFADMEKIIDYSYTAEKVTIIQAPLIVKTIPLTFRILPLFGPVVSRPISLQLRDEVKVYPKGAPVAISFTLSPLHILRIDPQSPAGFLTVNQRDHTDRYPLYPTLSSSDILRWDILPFYTALIACFFIIFLISIIVSLLKRKK